MISDIKYAHRAYGSMPMYETQLNADTVLDHCSFQELWHGLQREGKVLLCISQRTLDVCDEQTYQKLTASQRVLALYKDVDISPTDYNGFQG